MAPEGPNTQPLLEGLREEFGCEPFTVEEAMDFVRRSRFLETHLKRMTLMAAEKANPPQLAVNARPAPGNSRREKASRCGFFDFR